MEQYQPDDLLSTSQCAKIAGRHRRTILDWIHNKWLPAKRGRGIRSPFQVRYADLMQVATPQPWQEGGADGAADQTQSLRQT